MQCLYYPPEVGGLESHVRGLAEGLVRCGHRVLMLTSRSRPELPAHDEMKGVEVHRVWMPGRRPVAWVAHILATVPVHRRHAAEADIFHAQTFACVPPAALSRRAYPRPLVVTLHTSHFLVRARRARWRPILRRIVRAADYVLAPSAEIRDVALELYPHPRSEVLTNAVDTTRFRPAEGTRSGSRTRIIVPRRLYAKNGVEYFVRAMPRILESVDAEAWVIGDGPERERLVALARQLHLTDRVRLLGARPNDEMPELLAQGDVVVIPSLMEATSVAALEAMSCGLPVAASRVGGLPEIVDEEVGTLFEPGDPVGLADSVVRLIRATDRRERGVKARERVADRWSLDRLVERHVAIYSELLSA